jgi:hypothetical protein
MLLRALGETRCRACQWSKQSAPEGRDGDASLSDDVAAALAKRFGR